MKSRVPRSSDDWQQSPARKEKLYSQVVSSSAKMPPRVPRSSDDWQQSPINFPALPVRQVTLASNAKNHHNGTENRKKVLPFHMGTHASRTLSRVPYHSPSLSPFHNAGTKKKIVNPCLKSSAVKRSEHSRNFSSSDISAKEAASKSTRDPGYNPHYSIYFK